MTARAHLISPVEQEYPQSEIDLSKMESVTDSTLHRSAENRDTEPDPPRPAQKEEPKSTKLPPLACAFLDKLARLQLIDITAAQDFLFQNACKWNEAISANEVAGELVVKGLMTQYQLDRFFAGKVHGLVLGNHRVLDRLGAGGMGVVFLAEHVFMKRRVAIKVLPMEDDSNSGLLSRFYAEMRVLATLHHPHIVAAFDSGYVPSPDGRQPALLYLAMELVEGGDLESYVLKNGTVDTDTACNWMSQAATGLQEAHDHHLIHRDVKPSNVLLDRDNRVKLVDFGLAMQANSRQTIRGAVLGTIDFMPPEQSLDSSSVGVAADIYGLGATLFWLLTKETPLPRARTMREAMDQLQSGVPRLIRAFRPDVPPELDSFIQTMLERDPSRRPALPLTVSRILSAFCSRDARR